MLLVLFPSEQCKNSINPLSATVALYEDNTGTMLVRILE